MKCENCGGNLSLEDATCPHCGTVNSHAQQHIKDMNRYQGEFQKTRKNVYAVTQNYAGITVRAAIITVLLILIVVLSVLAASDYEIESGLARRESNRNFKEYEQLLNQYLEEENYLAFSAFCEARYLRGYDSPYEKYLPVQRASSQYAYLYEYIMRANTKQQEGADREDIARCAEYIGEQLNYFYESLDMERYTYVNGADSEQNRKALERMEQNVRLLLQTYCGLTEEDVADLQSLSNAKRMVLLEERMGYAE